MPENKNQHFVPKCHFKPFSVDRQGRCINVFNLRTATVAINASTKGQCSRSYFYGQDPDIEPIFSAAESAYGSIMPRLIEAVGDELSLICKALRSLSYLQYLRTEKELGSAKEYFRSALGAAHQGREPPRGDEIPDDWVIARDAVLSWQKTSAYVADLKTVILENRSDIPFITSDNPAVLTNRLYCQKFGRTDFGVAQSGSILFMPLSPRFASISYDADAYALASKSGHRVRVERGSDVRQLNHLQAMNCVENLYFTHSEDAELVKGIAAEVVALRVSHVHEMSVLIADGVRNDVERFRRATEEELKSATRRLMVSKNVHPKPLLWPSFMPFRSPPTGYVSGTAVGVVRKAIAAERPDINFSKKRF